LKRDAYSSSDGEKKHSEGKENGRATRYEDSDRGGLTQKVRKRNREARGRRNIRERRKERRNIPVVRT